jgi:hypothetical protein
MHGKKSQTTELRNGGLRPQEALFVRREKG